MAFITFRLAESDKVAADQLLAALIHAGVIDRKLITSDEQFHYYEFQDKIYRLEENLNFLTSYSATKMPADAPHFYENFLKRCKKGTLNHVWIVSKKNALEYSLCDSSFTLEDQFDEVCNRTRNRANAVLNAIISSGRLNDQHMVCHASKGIIVIFNDGTREGRLKDYICCIIGRKMQKPPRMADFFRDFIQAVDCYNLLPSSILESYVPSDQTSRRQALVKKFPISDPRIESVLTDLKSCSYTRSRKFLHYLETCGQSQIKICPYSQRIIYINYEKHACHGSHAGQLIKYVVSPFVFGAPVPRDVLIFYREFLCTRNFPSGMLGKHVLSNLMRMSTSGDTINKWLPDMGGKVVICTNCSTVHGIDGNEVDWATETRLPENSGCELTGFETRTINDHVPPNVTMYHNTINITRRPSLETYDIDIATTSSSGSNVMNTSLDVIKEEPE